MACCSQRAHTAGRSRELFTLSFQAVITGAGLVSSIGRTRDECWSSVLAGKSGIQGLSAIEQEFDPDPIGGEALAEAEDSSDLPREVIRLRMAMREVLSDIGMGTSYRSDVRHGIILGTTLSGMRSGGKYLRTKRPSDIGGFLAASTMDQLLDPYDWKGLAMTTSSACSSGLASICLGVSLLEAGILDLVFVGGYDPISEYAYSGFNSLRLISKDHPKPFSTERDGLQLGESYAILALERPDAARKRGADVLARVSGFGETSDSFHLTQPHPEGDGAARAIRTALKSSGLSPDDIGLISAHATATPNNDASEYAALKSVFQSSLKKTPLVAFKSYLGHTLGGAGAAELILTAMAMRKGCVPRTLHLEKEELEFDDVAVNCEPLFKSRIDHTLSVSLGFGGANSCVLLSSPDAQVPETAAASTPSEKTPRTVVITGVGVVLPGAVGNQEYVRRLKSQEQDLGGSIPESELHGHIDSRRIRRMSMFSKLVLAATTNAMRSAGIEDVASFSKTCGSVLGSSHGSSEYAEKYYSQVVDEGIAAANPVMFAEGVPNVGTAHLSLMLGLQGSAQTIIGSRTSGVDAIALAALRIRHGEWDRAIVGGADELSPTAEMLYGHTDRGIVSGAGGVMFVLESEESAQARGATVLARVGASAFGFDSSDHASKAQIDLIGDQIDLPERVIASLALSGKCGQKIDRDRSPDDVESHCVTPLTSISAALLGGVFPDRSESSSVVDGAPDFAVIASDMYGSVSGLILEVVT
jgi:3-oxoacyl-[acyl-carrier-protein] synthase II